MDFKKLFGEMGGGASFQYADVDETRKRLQDAAKAGTPESEPINIVKFISGDVEKVAAPDEEQDSPISERIKFVISDESIDRSGDVIKVDGWNLKNWFNNPVVLFGHDYSKPPVAMGQPRSKQDTAPAWVQGKRLYSIAGFPVRDLHEFGYMIGQMVKHGFLKTASVGMRPLEYLIAEAKGREGGLDFIAQELLEWSVVPVPANQNALMQAKGIGIDVSPFREFATKALDENVDTIRLWGVDRERVESLYFETKDATGAGVVVAVEKADQLPDATELIGEDDHIPDATKMVERLKGFAEKLIDNYGTWAHEFDQSLRFKNYNDMKAYDKILAMANDFECADSEDAINKAVEKHGQFIDLCDSIFLIKSGEFVDMPDADKIEKALSENKTINQPETFKAIVNHPESLPVAPADADWDWEKECQQAGEDDIQALLVHHHKDGTLNYKGVCLALASISGIGLMETETEKEAADHLFKHLHDDFPGNTCNIEPKHVFGRVLCEFPETFFYNHDACQIETLTQKAGAERCLKADIADAMERVDISIDNYKDAAPELCKQVTTILDMLDGILSGDQRNEDKKVDLDNADTKGHIDHKDTDQDLMIRFEICNAQTPEKIADTNTIKIAGMDGETLTATIAKAVSEVIAAQTGRVID